MRVRECLKCADKRIIVAMWLGFKSGRGEMFELERRICLWKDQRLEKKRRKSGPIEL